MSTAPVLPSGSPWHRGEIAMQARVGVDARMDAIGRRVIRDHMPDQHREFFAQLPFLVVGSVDAADQAWATLIAGRPGFATAPDPTTLSIRAGLDPDDPVTAGIIDDAGVGLLGIELHTRRRNRMNGRVRQRTGGFDVVVDHSFGNCPQYIQLRGLRWVRDPAAPANGGVEVLDALDAEALRAIAEADTFFVASYGDEGGRRQVDVSHRGGRAGFVRVEGDTLTIPDFAGNFFFATLGNILLNGRAGLVFPDFATGDMLHLTGDAGLLPDGPEVAAFDGAERFWRFRPRRIVRRRDALPLRWSFDEDGWSPNSLMTGDWTQAASRLRASERADAWRPFRIERVVDESSTIRSFHLAAADDAGLVPNGAGQHLPIRVVLPGTERPTIRTYTLSSAPSDRTYRISVKREGAVSSFLHERMRVGDVIEARPPAGAFTIDAASKRPALLIAAGIGITPVLAMLRHVMFKGVRTRGIRPVWLVHGARSVAERGFDREIAELASVSGGAVRVTRTLSDPSGADPRDYDRAGRIDRALLRDVVTAAPDAEVYLCGPAGFMQSAYDDLLALGVPDAAIRAEAFGPSALKRRTKPGEPTAAGREVATGPVPVAFLASGKEARWTPQAGSLLELAEARGLSPEFGCRQGSCGTCRTRILKGAVAYTVPPSASVAEDEALICVAVPAAPDGPASATIHLDL